MGARMSIEIDDRELHQLAVDIGGAPWRVTRNARTALSRSAALVDEQMTIDAYGHRGNWFGRPGTDYATKLDLHVSHELLGNWTADIGIEYKGVGKLAHIIVYGSANNAPVYDHTAALRRSIPQILQKFGEAAEDSVLGGGD